VRSRIRIRPPPFGRTPWRERGRAMPALRACANRRRSAGRCRLRGSRSLHGNGHSGNGGPGRGRCNPRGTATSCGAGVARLAGVRGLAELSGFSYLNAASPNPRRRKPTLASGCQSQTGRADFGPAMISRGLTSPVLEEHFTSSTRVRDVPQAAPEETIEQRVQRLLATWREKTGFLSSSTALISHPAYQKSISIVPAALPFLLERARRC
jgi:hypothetical protein